MLAKIKKVYTNCNHMHRHGWDSGAIAKSRQRKFVPSSHTGPFALVASPGKSKTKVGTLDCFDFFVKE